MIRAVVIRHPVLIIVSGCNVQKPWAKPGGTPELAAVFGREFGRDGLTIGRRPLADIDDDIEKRGGNAGDELALRVRIDLEMQPAHRAGLGGKGPVVLDKGIGPISLSNRLRRKVSMK